MTPIYFDIILDKEAGVPKNISDRLVRDRGQTCNCRDDTQ